MPGGLILMQIFVRGGVVYSILECGSETLKHFRVHYLTGDSI